MPLWLVLSKPVDSIVTRIMVYGVFYLHVTRCPNFFGTGIVLFLLAFHHCVSSSSDPARFSSPPLISTFHCKLLESISSPSRIGGQHTHTTDTQRHTNSQYFLQLTNLSNCCENMWKPHSQMKCVSCISYSINTSRWETARDPSPSAAKLIKFLRTKAWGVELSWESRVFVCLTRGRGSSERSNGTEDGDEKEMCFLSR